MEWTQRGAGIRRLRAVRLTPSEIISAGSVVGLVAVVGAVARSPTSQIYLLSVAWALLIGVMLPRLMEARRESKAFATIRQQEARQRVVNHDMASALLTIEGGIMALRMTCSADENPGNEALAEHVEGIAHAIETEIRRIRRVAAAPAVGEQSCRVAHTIAPLIALHRANGARCDVLLTSDVEVGMAADDLARVVSNVLDNCARYAPGALVQVSGFVVADRYHVVIGDDGPGIRPDLIDHVFERGTSSRDSGGLGLYSVRLLVEAVGGSVTLWRERGDSIGARGGATVHVRLPIASSAAMPASSSGESTSSLRVVA